MALIYNNNDRFGAAGPFECDSFESLADSLNETFEGYANDAWNNMNSAECEALDYTGWIAEKVASIRSEFISGLEYVPEQVDG